MSDTPKPPEQAPKIAELDAILALPDAENFSEATIKYEAPETRRAKETLAAANAAHERLVTLLKLGYAGALLLGFFAFGIYLFAFKANATDVQRLYASTVLTAMASGSEAMLLAKNRKSRKKNKHGVSSPLVANSCYLYGKRKQRGVPTIG